MSWIDFEPSILTDPGYCQIDLLGLAEPQDVSAENQKFLNGCPVHARHSFVGFAPRTMPSADSCSAIRYPLGFLSPVRDTGQVSLGKSNRPRSTTAGSKPQAIDGYQLCDHKPAGPT